MFTYLAWAMKKHFCRFQHKNVAGFFRNEVEGLLENVEQLPPCSIEVPLTRSTVAWYVLHLCHCVVGVVGDRLTPVDRSAYFVSYDAADFRGSVVFVSVGGSERLCCQWGLSKNTRKHNKPQTKARRPALDRPFFCKYPKTAKIHGR